MITCNDFTGANDLTVNPNKKPTPTKGVLPATPVSKEEIDHESEIEMSLRLVCSMSGNRSKAFWEDVTDTTPMTVVLNKDSTNGKNKNLNFQALHWRKLFAWFSANANPGDKYNLSPAFVVQDPSTAVDLRKTNGAQQRIYPSEDRSPGSVQFTSLVSASFWLVHCPNWMSSDVISLVDQIYKVN
jgi:hypothetical protein